MAAGLPGRSGAGCARGPPAPGRTTPPLAVKKGRARWAWSDRRPPEAGAARSPWVRKGRQRQGVRGAQPVVLTTFWAGT